MSLYQHALCVVIRDELHDLLLAQVDFCIWFWTRCMERTEIQKIVFDRQIVFLLVERKRMKNREIWKVPILQVIV